ncbi:GTPase-activating protein CdGAPr-like [Ostrinia furnacalis]|uniref:GTPase-activating protein CdGAPr-like n=1 Tax=Ostrinia furnacalis TaxID=93504 RepID=UPI00103E9E19|nr:GTPase-activating protein CdGAPr-like [Ostrinia furnacalis]
MRTVPKWVNKIHEADKVEFSSVHTICFSPDGTQLVVGAGEKVMVYDPRDGSLVQLLQAHKGPVHAVAYCSDGKKFASGSADKNVIIWTSKMEGVLKYSHGDAIQCLTYNPVTMHLASCAISDFAFWSADVKAVQKFRLSGRITSCSWSPNGQHLAIGLASGAVSIRDKVGDEIQRILRESAVWAVAFTKSMLMIADWSDVISFYDMQGQVVYKERNIGIAALSMTPLGSLVLVGGVGGWAVLTSEGVSIITTQQEWVWAVAPSPSLNTMAVACQDGTLWCYQVVFSTVHGLYRERYAYRENMTDVIIQHLTTGSKVRIKCHDRVQKIAIYKHRLAGTPLQGVAVQAVVTEFLICYAEDLFAQDQGADSSDSGPSSIEVDKNETIEAQVELRGLESGRRPKSLPLNPPTKLLSLEEARRRGNPAASLQSPQLPPASGAIAAAAHTQLRPSSHLRPKYIEVGSGPNNLPQYHTVLDLPIPGKRGVKRSPSGWRGLFSRSKQRPTVHAPLPPVTPPATTQEPTALAVNGLRPVKSCESLTSDTDTLAPLAVRPPAPLKQHTRSSSCDSYFEPWQAELAGMRLRLSPQERDLHMFSEEDDPQQRAQDGDSAASTPPSSLVCSASPSPQRLHNTDSRKRSLLEEQLSEIGYIDLESPRARAPAAEKRAPRPPSPPSPPPPRAERKRICKDRDNATPPLADTQTSLGNVKMRERASPRKAPPSARYSGLHQPLALPPRLSWPGKDHSTLIKVDWPPDSSSTNLTASTLNSSPATPLTPLYDPLESDSEVSETNKHTIKIESKECDNCDREKCLKCELKATDYSSEHSPLHSTDISYQNLNRLSAVSTSSNSEPSKKDASYENCDVMKVMTSSHESSSSYSNASLKQEDYETFNFTRPNYINLQSSSTSKSSPGSPLKSPLKSTISITFRSPTKSKTPDYEPIDNIDTPTNDRDSVYEDIDLEKNLSIVEEATVPETDASLPTQQACQPDFKDLIILETPTDQNDVYSQVKFFKKSIEEVNALIFESPEKEAEENAIMFEFPEEKRHYENVSFSGSVEKEYENINVDTLKICDKGLVEIDNGIKEEEKDNGNIIKVSNLNVRELANRFESPTEQKGPFTFEKFKAEIKYPSLERKEEDKKINVEVRKKDLTVKLPPPVSPKTYKLNKNSCNARSLDENAFVKEFGNEKSYVDRRKSLEVRDAKKSPKFLPDLNLNMEENTKIEPVTPTTENKISLVQRFNEKRPTELKNLINFDSDKKLSRERIEKYKEERRNFLREKYSSQSFRSSPEQLTRIKIKKDMDKIESCERLKEELPKFERRNTVDLGQRMRFSLARSTNNLDTINSPTSPDSIERREGESSKRERESAARREFDRKEKVSPSYHIRDMAALFEQKTGG